MVIRFCLMKFLYICIKSKVVEKNFVQYLLAFLLEIQQFTKIKLSYITLNLGTKISFLTNFKVAKLL